MTSLLRGDLYRLVRSSTTWISLAAVIGIGLASFVAVWAPTTDAGRAAFEGATSFYDGTGGIGYLLGQLLPIWMLFVSLDASEHLSMELESGYVVSLVTIGRGSSRRWRRTVVAERLVLAALMAAVWVLAGALATCVPFAVALGIGLDGATVASLAS